MARTKRTDVRLQAAWHLTDRERDILRCLPLGMTNREIARHLHLSEHSVKHYLGRLLLKTGAHRRTAIVARVAAIEGARP